MILLVLSYVTTTSTTNDNINSVNILMIVILGVSDSYTPNDNAAAGASTTHFEVTQKALHCFYAVEHREDAM